MEFMGLYGFQWFTGIVESRDDPDMLGRVKVRIHGHHSEKRVPDINSGEGIPVEDLPWAYPLQDIRSAAMNGIGQTPLGPVEGTHVVGFARDEAFQDLVIMGTLGGIPQEGPKNEGFNDPNKKYPKSDFVKEPDTHRLARNKNIGDTIIAVKRDMERHGIPMADGGTWDEPSTEYNAEYPFNHVRESESGHHEEWDDTPGKERLHKWHKSGTFDEIYPDGREVKKIVNDQYELIMGSDYLLVDGDQSETVTGDFKLYVKGNVTILVDGNVDQTVHGNVVEQVDGNVDQTVDGNVTQEIGGNADTSIGGNLTTDVSGNASISVGGNASIDASGETEIIGSIVKLNDVTGMGVVCQMHTCAFTGGPHPEGSKTVMGEK